MPLSRSEFAARYCLWNDASFGEDRHSLFNQVSGLVWDTRVFMVVRKARDLTPTEAGSSRLQLNGILHKWIDRNFASSCAMGIRRLVDNFPIHGKKAVYSLAPLIQDLLDHRESITRENLVAARALTSEDGESRTAAERFFSSDSRLSLPPGRDDFTWYVSAHEGMDKLSGCSRQHRADDDVPSVEFLESRLESIKSAAKKAADYATKFVAHAAAPGNQPETEPLVLDDLWVPIQVIAKCTNEISGPLTGTSGSWQHIANADLFKYFDFPLVPTNNLPELATEWRRSGEEVQAW